MSESLRTFLDFLRREDLLLTVSKAVDPHLELSAVMQKAEQAGKSILFQNVAGNGFPVINNLLPSRKVLARLFEREEKDVAGEYLARTKSPIEPSMVVDSPVKQTIRIGGDVDLTELPMVTHRQKDAGPYITAGMVIAKDPETGIRNVSINRMQLKGRNKLGIRMMPPQHLGVIFSKYEKMGRNMEVAVSIGNHPYDILAAVTPAEYGVDELSIAGALRRAPLELVGCETVALEAPACSEIILEGEVLCGVREDEGPFGDFMQFYVPVMANNVLMVKAVTYRNDAIYQTIQAGSIEDTLYLGTSREAAIHQAVSRVADAAAVALNPTILGGAVAIHKKSDDEPGRVLQEVFKAYPWLKYCIVVDHDVDVFNTRDLWWALATRCRPADGVMKIDHLDGFPRDPHSRHDSKIGLNATVPVGRWEEFGRTSTSGFESISLADYI